MNNLNLIFPEIFISLTLMFLLIFGVFKKNSSSLIYNLSSISLIVLFTLNLKFIDQTNGYIFADSYKIDELSTFMKILISNHIEKFLM